MNRVQTHNFSGDRFKNMNLNYNIYIINEVCNVSLYLIQDIELILVYL